MKTWQLARNNVSTHRSDRLQRLQECAASRGRAVLAAQQTRLELALAKDSAPPSGTSAYEASARLGAAAGRLQQ